MNYSIFFLLFLGLHLQHREIPKLGVKLGLQLPAYGHSHGNDTTFEPHLQPTLHLAVSLDP